MNAIDILPKEFIERISKIIPKELLPESLHSFTVRKPSTFRTNTLKITVDELKQELQKRNIPFQEVSWYKHAFILDTYPQKLLSDTDLYTDGKLYIQSLSSMIPSLIMDPHQNEKILDLTAAPGSKTTQLAMMLQNTGEIVANDISRVRLYKLEANLRMQGVTNTKVVNIPGEFLWRKYPEYFDKALVDVPCTLEGRFYTEDPKSYKDWTPKKVKILAEKQRYLLRSAINATKPGGLIVYSTCTLEPEENEGVIDWILKKANGAVVLESIALSIDGMYEGIKEWNNKVYDETITKTKRILPSVQMEGFFVASLRKTKSQFIGESEDGISPFFRKKKFKKRR